MGIFDFDQGGSGNYWNFSDQNKDNFALQIRGDVVKVAAVPKTKFGSKTNEIDRFPDGNPKMCFELTLNSNGKQVIWGGISLGSRSHPSNAMTAIRQALQNHGLPGKSLEELAGMNITVTTQAPPQGFNYGQGNPRPFEVVVNGGGTSEFEGMEDRVTELRPDRQQAAQNAPSQAQMQQQAQVQQQQYNAAQAQAQQAQPNFGSVTPQQAAANNQNVQWQPQQQAQPYSDSDIPF